MSLWLGLRRVSQSFNTLMRHRSLAHRHFTAQSCSRRVLFLAERMGERYFYLAKIQKDGTLGPATMLPPIPFKLNFGLGLLWSRIAVVNGKIFLFLDGRLYICSPDTGEYSTLPDVPPPLTFPVKNLRIGRCCYFGFDTLSNEHKVLFVQEVWQSQKSLKRNHPKNRKTLLKRLFWVFTQGSASWSQIHPFLPEQMFGFPEDLRGVVFANGAIHCIYYRPSTSTSKYILAFDMVEAQLRKIPYPDYSFPGKLTQFGGRLALIEKFPMRGSILSLVLQEAPEDVEYDKLQLWILEDYNNHKWVKETIQLPFGWMRYKDLLAFNYNTGEMLLEFRGSEGRLVGDDYLLYYNTKTGTFRQAEATRFPNWSENEHDNFYVIDVNFDDEMDRQKSF